MPKQGNFGSVVADAHRQAGPNHPANTAVILPKRKFKKIKIVGDVELFRKYYDICMSYYTSKKVFCESLGLSTQAVSSWHRGAEPVPKYAVVAVEGLYRRILAERQHSGVEPKIETVINDQFDVDDLKNIASLAISADDFELAKKAMDLI